MKYWASTVLEQDHFCRCFLVSHETVLTNSQNHEDEMSWGSTGKRRPTVASAKVAVLMNISFEGHKGLSDGETKKTRFWDFSGIVPSTNSVLLVLIFAFDAT